MIYLSYALGAALLLYITSYLREVYLRKKGKKISICNKCYNHANLSDEPFFMPCSVCRSLSKEERIADVKNMPNFFKPLTWKNRTYTLKN